MLIQVCSDLHREFGIREDLYEKMISTEADVLVLAGDISNSRNITDSLLRIQEDSNKPIIFVPGNHEYYHSTRKTLDKELLSIKHLNDKIHVLIEDEFCIDDVVFIGSTGWWDGSNGEVGLTVKQGLNDFLLIYDLMDEENLDGIAWGREAAIYLSLRMHHYRCNFPDKKLCIVTHHYPHPRSLSPQYNNSPLNVCFGNRWEWMIERYQPEYWIHGHTHDGFDYIVSENDHNKLYDELRKTRIICNPQGYPEKIMVGGEIINSTENRKFDPTKVIEL